AMLNSPECPLDTPAREQAKRNHAFTAARGAYRLVKRRRFSAAAEVIAHAGLRPIEWLHYLRPPRRATSAGTPSAEQSSSASSRASSSASSSTSSSTLSSALPSHARPSDAPSEARAS